MNWILICLASYASALPCFYHHDTSHAVDQMLHDIAIVGEDDREIRERGSLEEHLEAAQARIWCSDRLKLKPGQVPTKQQFQGGWVSNATIAFQDDLAIVNRHNFLEPNGSRSTKTSFCFIEHIKTSEFIPIVDVEYPPQPNASKNMRPHRDFAVVRLGRKLENGTAVRSEDIIIDKQRDPNANVTVVSNYAKNNKTGRSNEAMTITTCKRKGMFGLADGSMSNVTTTDCDTGLGSSGAQAYLTIGRQKKLFGIVSGETKLDKEGGAYNSDRLQTSIVQFDSTLFESVEKIRARSSIRNSLTDL